MTMNKNIIETIINLPAGCFGTFKIFPETGLVDKDHTSDGESFCGSLMNHWQDFL